MSQMTLNVEQSKQVQDLRHAGFAVIVWVPADVKSYFEGKDGPAWTDDQCIQWLSDNGHHIEDRCIEWGWDAVYTLVGMDIKEEKEPWDK